MSPTTGRYLAVVPARGGSKRVPRKNVRPFHGIPLLGHTLLALGRASVFDAVVVSTDDGEIAEVGRQFDALVPFTRPANLSTDWATTASVIAHAIRAVDSDLGSFDAVCCVYPGAVFMTPDDYLSSSQLVGEALGRNAVVAAVVPYSHPIQRALHLGPDGLLVSVNANDALEARTQDLDPTWHDAGQFYWASPARWSTSRPLLSSVLPYEVPSWRAHDIDTEDDWRRAELLFPILQQVNADGVSSKGSNHSGSGGDRGSQLPA